MNEFLQALRENNREDIRSFLEAGADPNSEFEGKVCLRYALGSPDIVRMLLNYKANPEIKDQQERSLLIDTIYKQDLPSMNLFLGCGVDPDVPDEEGHIPFGCALYCVVNEEVVKLLMFYNANANQYDNARQTFPFIEAARNYPLALLKELIEYGADPLVRNPTGVTALLVAVKPGNAEMVSFLIKIGLDVNDNKNRWGDTPLHRAAEYTDSDLLRLLVEIGADPNIKNNEGETPLDILLAKKEISPALVRLCIEILRKEKQ